MMEQQYRQISYYVPRLSPEEERLQQMLEEHRVSFERWFRQYMNQQLWSSYSNPHFDPWKVIPIPPLKIRYRFCSLPQVSVQAESELPMATMTIGNVTVWQEWNSLYYQYQLQGTATAANSISNYGTGTTAQDVWMQWNQYYQQQTGMMTPPVSRVAEITPEQLAQQRELAARQQEEARVAACKRDEERAAAKQKAKELLVSALEAEQKASFEKNGYFDVVVKDKTYRIKPGEMILLLNEKRVVCRYCIHPEHGSQLPHEDVALSQKLLLESSEETFLTIANRHSV